MLFRDILQVNGNKLGAHAGPEMGGNLSIECFVLGKYSDLDEMKCTSESGSLWQGLSSAKAAICSLFSK